ncbi:MAG: hypothetical protein LBL98_02470 [Ruminococcus sp.]|jgi:hypothetical protein|nr:hypothetical protein [Ruminococcus sp.]
MKKVVILAVIMLFCACNITPAAVEITDTSTALTITETVTVKTTVTEKPTETTTETTVLLTPDTALVNEPSEEEETTPQAEKIELPQNEYIYGDSGLYITSDYDKNTITIYNADGRALTTEDSMEVWNDRLDYSLDRKEAAYIQSIGYGLYYINAEDMEPVFIDNHAQYFKMALSGNAVAYTDSDYENAYLYLWDGNEKTLITENCYDPEVFLISPDGKTVLYQERVNQRHNYYYYTGGTVTFIEEDIDPIAISNNGIVYYKKDYIHDNHLYVQKGGDIENRLGLHEVEYSALAADYVFNKDLTEMICYNDGEVFIIKDGELVNSFADDYRTDNHFFPDSTAIEGEYSPLQGKNLKAFGTDTFVGTYYIPKDRNLYCFDEDFNLVKVFDGVINNRTNRPIDYKLSRDGKILTVKLNNKMYRYEITDPNSLYEYDVSHKIEFLIPAEDGNSIYYFTQTGELFYMKPNEEPLLIASDLAEFDENFRDNNYCAIINNNEMLFLNDGVLYFTDGASLTKKAEGFRSLSRSGGVYFLTDKDGEIIDAGGF